MQEYLNKNFSSFSQKELSDIVQRIFAEEMELEKKRLSQVYQQTIPFSQGAKAEQEDGAELGIEKLVDGDITASDEIEDTIITKTDGVLAVEEAERVEELLMPMAESKDFTEVDADLPQQSKSTEAIGRKEVAVQGSPVEKEEYTKEDTLSTELAGIKPLLSPSKPEKRGSVTSSTQTGEALDLSRIEPPPSSGISLSDTDLRSVYGKQRSSSPNRRFELEESPGAENDRIEEPFILDEAESIFRKLSRTIVTLTLVFTFFAGTVYLYKVYIDGRLVKYFPSPKKSAPAANEKPRQISVSPTEPVGTAPKAKPSVDLCPVEVSSEPSGVTVFIEGTEAGKTPYLKNLECTKDITVKLKYEDANSFYKVYEVNIVPDTKRRLHKRMDRIPTGFLELSLDINATVVTDDGRSLEARRAPVVIKLVAGKHELQFINEAYKIDVKKSYTILDGQNLRKSEVLNITPTRRPSKK